MTPDELRAAGVELYGPQWQTPLAKDLECAVRTVRAWLKGTRAIPGPACVAVRLLVERKRGIALNAAFLPLTDDLEPQEINPMRTRPQPVMGRLVTIRSEPADDEPSQP